MKTCYNNKFKELLLEYNLPLDFSFTIDLPTEVQNIIDDQILITELGITLKSFNRLYKASQEWENQSIIEDNENHFHVDWFIEPSDDKKIFMLGVKTLILLANKFQKEEIKGIRFWYSFQTAELAKLWAKHHNLAEVDDEDFASDRLSFYTLREGEDVVSLSNNEDKFCAILIIDI